MRNNDFEFEGNNISK